MINVTRVMSRASLLDMTIDGVTEEGDDDRDEAYRLQGRCEYCACTGFLSQPQLTAIWYENRREDKLRANRKKRRRAYKRTVKRFKPLKSSTQ